MRVLPEGSIDKTFDYLVPPDDAERVRVGTMVRVSLHGRRVAAWVVAEDVEPPEGVALKPLAKVTGWGPTVEVVGGDEVVEALVDRALGQDPHHAGPAVGRIVDGHRRTGAGAARCRARS